MSSFDAVVFDLDYTLAVTDRDRQALLDDATERAGAHDIERAAYLDAHGTVAATETRAPIFERLVTDDTDPDELAMAYRLAIEDALVPVDGVPGLLADLHESYRVGLLTDGPIAAQRDKLRTLDWAGLFDAVVITGSLPTGKPDERAFAAVCDDLDVDRAGTVYVGDRPAVDVEGAADAGLATVQVLYPGGPESHAAADAVVDRDELVARLPEILPTL
ncbi:HAD family hydrolase [Halorientalis sp.]|uniref:HAD family hydrolase n=1 Tax=Halorientalis sp. TaxID=1931229 RepID=UPI002610E790|nr:HAD family hydrolase [Halorientalis sp.]